MTNKIFLSVNEISGDFNGILLDAYGVFWAGGEVGVLPGARKAMETLVANGKIVGILSNSTQLGLKEINKLNLHGLIQGKHFHFLLTSGQVTRNIFLNKELPFETPRNKFFLFGGSHPRYSSQEAIFESTVYRETLDVEEADFIYISVPHINGEDMENPDLFIERIEKLKKKKLPMICPNPDQFAHEGKPLRAVVRQGSIAAIYERIGGQVFYIGKPYPQVYHAAMNDFKRYHLVKPSEILMVGDTPETDIRGAKNFGMSSALVIETGMMSDRVSSFGLGEAIKALPPQDRPEFFIKAMGKNEF